MNPENDEENKSGGEPGDLSMEPDLITDLDRVMRLLRRRPHGGSHGGRGTHRLLRIIAEEPGLSTRELSRRMEIRPASLNEKLSRLEDAGFIRRHRDPRDQRVFLVDIEPAGADQLKAAQAQRGSLNEVIRGILTPSEIREMSRLARRLAEGLDRPDEDPEDDARIHLAEVTDHGR